MNLKNDLKLVFTIRKAKEIDIEEILKLWKILAEFHSNLDTVFEPSDDAIDIAREYLIEQVTKENTSFLIAEEVKTKKIVGYCKGNIANYPPVFKMQKYGRISDIVVHSNYRNRNLGKSLFEEMKNWFLQKDITRLELRVASTNPISPNFWKKMGFQEVRKVLYQNIS